MRGHWLHYLLVDFSFPLVRVVYNVFPSCAMRIVRCVLGVMYDVLCAMSALTFVVWQSDTGCLLCAVPGVGCGRRAGAGDVPEGHARVGRGQQLGLGAHERARLGLGPLRAPRPGLRAHDPAPATEAGHSPGLGLGPDPSCNGPFHLRAAEAVSLACFDLWSYFLLQIGNVVFDVST
jgi:hypothetical protein